MSMLDTAPGDFLTIGQARELLVEAERAKAEAAVDRRAAEKALADARYAQGQAEFQNREASAKIAAVQRREENLKQYAAQEAALAEREKAVDEKLRRANEIMSRYDADKHRAMLNLGTQSGPEKIMSDTEETAAITPPPVPDAFTAALTLCQVALDPKATGARLRDLQEKISAAMKAEASLAAAKAEHDAAISKERAELDQRKAKLGEREVELLAKSAGVEQRHRELRDVHAAIKEREDQLKRRLLYHAGHTINEKLQSIPSWEEVDRICFGRPDPHFDQQQPQREGAGETEGERLPDAPPELSIRRAVPISPERSATQRRADRRAAEGHAA